jgi:hypothetical protein
MRSHESESLTNQTSKDKTYKKQLITQKDLKIIEDEKTLIRWQIKITLTKKIPKE